MNEETHRVIMERYETYCHAFISIAGQVQHLEDVHGLDLSDTKNSMFSLLDQFAAARPDWWADHT